MFGNKSITRITLLQLYMYFVGPMIWGAWMIGRLKLITQQEFLFCLFSPISIVLFPGYFVLNNLYTRYTIRRLKASAANHSASCKKIRSLSVLEFHCASIVTFGTLGTTCFMVRLSAYHDTFYVSHYSWVPKVILGALSGISLVFAFYTFFSVTIFNNIISLYQTEEPETTVKTLEKLRSFHSYLYSVGIFLLITTSIAAYTIRLQEAGTEVDYLNFLLNIMSTVFPIIMSYLLYRRSIMSLHRTLNLLCPEKGYDSQFPGKSTKEMLQRVVRWLLLSFFVVVIIEDITRLWLVILITGFCCSIFFGRVYCSWACPVNTVSAMEKKLYTLSGIKKRGMPGVFKYSFMKYAWVVLLGSMIVVMSVSSGKVSIFIAITVAGILVSTVYTSVLWCKYLCPWARIFNLLERVSLRNRVLPKKNCPNCTSCSKQTD